MLAQFQQADAFSERGQSLEEPEGRCPRI